MFDPMTFEAMQTYKGLRPSPEDFIEFWQKQMNALESVPNYSIEEKDFNLAQLFCYDLTFDGVNQGYIYSKYVRPRTDKPVTVVVIFHGYKGQGPDWSELFKYAMNGYAAVAMDVRGQAGKSYGHHLSNGTTATGHIVQGMIQGPEKLYYRDVYLDVYQIVNLLANLPGIDSDAIYAFGGSQGGALAIVAAALSQKVKRVVAQYPFLSDFDRVIQAWNMSAAYEELRRYFKFEDPSYNSYEDIMTTLSYIDVKNFAQILEADLKLIIGLRDDVCYPSTQYAFYNNYQGPKELLLLPEYGHEDMNVQVKDTIYNWLTGSSIHT